MEKGDSEDQVFGWSVTNLALGMFGIFPIAMTVSLVFDHLLAPSGVRMDATNNDEILPALMVWAPLFSCWIGVSWIVNLKLRQRGSLRAVTGFWGRSLLLLILPAASYYLVAGVVGLLATAVLR